MKFSESKANGPHALLAKMSGTWEGMQRLWLEPDKLEEEVEIVGTLRPILDGMFLQHEYTSSCMGKPQTGLAWYGYSCGEDRWTTAWIDSFHNGTRIMLSQGAVGADTTKPQVLGHYPAAPDPDWGWRTTLELKADDHLVITHYNLTPQGQEAKAVEIEYRRAS